VQEIDADGKPMDEQYFKWPYKLNIPATMPGVTNQDGNPRQGHYLEYVKDAYGAEKAVIGYYLEDDMDAREMQVDLVPPALCAALSHTGLPTAVNTPHLDIGIYTFTTSDEDGEYTAVFRGSDSHGPEYRDHQDKRMLAVNDRNTRGDWEVVSVHFMKPDYSAPQPFYEHIYRQGEKLYLQVRLKPKKAGSQPQPPPATKVKLLSRVTDPIGFTVEVPYHHTDPQDGNAYYRMQAGTEPKVGSHTNVSNRIIGVKAGNDDVKERTTHDDHDYSDSDALRYGGERGKGRAWADVSEEREILPANLEYLQAGGVEFLVVSSVINPNKKDKVPAKNQADLLYFSGHGLSSNGKIFNNATLAETSVDDIAPTTNWSEDLNCFVIAGCSVLNIATKTGHDLDVGIEWANKSIAGRVPGGLLDSLCGYHDSAPSDSSPDRVTQRIAAEFSTRFSGSNGPQAWREANNAVVNTWWAAMDREYYYWHWKGTILWHDEQEAY